MQANDVLYDQHAGCTSFESSNDVRPRKRLYHKVSPRIVGSINAGLPIKFVKGPMEQFMK